MAQIFLYHLALWMQTHMGPLVNGPLPIAGYIDYQKLYNEHDHERQPNFRGRIVTMNSIKIVNGGKTLILEYKHKRREINRRTNTYFFKWEAVMTVGVSIKDDGIVRMWSKQMDFYRTLGWEELERNIPLHTTMIPNNQVDRIITEFAHINGAESLQDLCLPWARKLGWAAENVGMPWAVRVLQAQHIGEFWSRLSKRKLAKDEKRALWAAMEANPANMAIVRLAGMVDVPNLRTVEVDTTYPLSMYDRRLSLKMAEIKVMAKQLRVIPPHRRTMFINALLQNHGEPKIKAADTLRMVYRYTREGVFPEGMNLPTVDAYHEACVREQRRIFEEQQRELEALREQRRLEAQAREAQWRLDNAELWARMEEERIERERIEAERWEKTKEAQKVAYNLHREIIPGTNIEVVMPSDAAEVRLWGNEQGHCIGSYTGRMIQGKVILMGFRQSGKWIGHASIEGGHISMLLGKFNTRLPAKEKMFIAEYLVEKGVADSTDIGWG
jgi:hypothetical protein